MTHFSNIEFLTHFLIILSLFYTTRLILYFIYSLLTLECDI